MRHRIMANYGHYIGGVAMGKESQEVKRFVIVQSELPEQFPTHLHSAQFWEDLGRTIAAFGFLEEVLKKAIFALTATRRYDTREELEAAYENWLPKLKIVLGDTLKSLAKQYSIAANDHHDQSVSGVDELVDDIMDATVIRNALCHGSWRKPDATGKSLPFFYSKRSGVFDTSIDVEYLRQVQRCVRNYSCAIINSVTFRGLQFPGSSGPGIEIWPSS